MSAPGFVFALLSLVACRSVSGDAASVDVGPPPIILVSLDTLRADQLGAWGGPPGLTPNLDRFTAEAIAFESAWSQANFTLMSHASLFTSRYPSELGLVRNDFRLGSEPPTLAGVLGTYGYATAAFTGGGQLSGGYGLDRGFDTFEVPVRFGMGCLFHTAPPALSWIAAQPADRPWFAFVHAYDAHAPYVKPTPFGLGWARGITRRPDAVSIPQLMRSHVIFGPFLAGDDNVTLGNEHFARRWDARARQVALSTLGREGANARRLDDSDLAYLAALYQGAVAYEDAWFGWFLAALERQGVPDRAIIVVVSDHGESLGEKGRFDHTYSLDDRDIHVPLLVRMPGGRGGGRRVPAMVGLVDVLPTLLDFAGATPPAGIVGQSLRPWLEHGDGPERPYVYSEGNLDMVSLRTPEARIVFSGVAAHSPYLPLLLEHTQLASAAFEDTTTTDPGERERLRALLLEARRALRPAPGLQGAADPAVIREMQARGYWVAP